MPPGMGGHGYESDTNRLTTSPRPEAAVSMYFVSEVTMSSSNLPILAPNAYDPFEEEARRWEIRALPLA